MRYVYQAIYDCETLIMSTNKRQAVQAVADKLTNTDLSKAWYRYAYVIKHTLGTNEQEMLDDDVRKAHAKKSSLNRVHEDGTSTNGRMEEAESKGTSLRDV